MHPLFRNRRSFAAYLMLWAVIAGLLAALMSATGTVALADALLLAAPLCLFYSFLCLTPFYVCRALPPGSTPAWRLASNHGGAAILACALWIGAAEGIAATFELGSRIETVLPHLVAVGLLLYVLSVALHYAFLAVQASREAALQARDAELRALKSQINPHFLFNCLNSISALTASDPGRAREMCVRLSDFLRNTLGLGERESIPWREELELARAYLEVEQVRFGARLQVEMDVDDACAECRVPPLVLQPLIENAIKHGIATLVEGGTIRLESRILGDSLAVSVENRFDPDAPQPRRHGLGLRNVRNRLATRFGAAATMNVASADNHFRAEMMFPCLKESK
jgi:two-component system, LytTR family, sensor histidine kinase AlgZ